MELEIHLSGGLQTWGIILLFAWMLSMLGILYEWIFANALTFKSSICKELDYITSIT